MLYSNITDDLLLLEKQMKTRLNKDAMGEPLDAWVTGPEGPKTVCRATLFSPATLPPPARSLHPTFHPIRCLYPLPPLVLSGHHPSLVLLTPPSFLGDPGARLFVCLYSLLAIPL